MIINVPTFHRFLMLLACLLFLNACSGPAQATPGAAEKPREMDVTIVTDTAAAPAATSGAEPTAGSAPTANGPMQLVILSPEDDAEVNSAEIEIKGQAKPGSVITVNDEVIMAGSDRLFSVQLALEPGLNVIEIDASDDQGNQVTQYLTVTSDVQEP